MNTFCVPGAGRHDFMAQGARPTRPPQLPTDQTRPVRSAAPWTALPPPPRPVPAPGLCAHARRPGPASLHRGQRLVGWGGGLIWQIQISREGAWRQRGCREEGRNRLARIRFRRGGGGGTRGEITQEQCRFRLKMLPAMGVHVERLSWRGCTWMPLAPARLPSLPPL